MLHGKNVSGPAGKRQRRVLWEARRCPEADESVFRGRLGLRRRSRHQPAERAETGSAGRRPHAAAGGRPVRAEGSGRAGSKAKASGFGGVRNGICVFNVYDARRAIYHAETMQLPCRRGASRRDLRERRFAQTRHRSKAQRQHRVHGHLDHSRDRRPCAHQGLSVSQGGDPDCRQ